MVLRGYERLAVSMNNLRATVPQHFQLQRIERKPHIPYLGTPSATHQAQFLARPSQRENIRAGPEGRNVGFVDMVAIFHTVVQSCTVLHKIPIARLRAECSTKKIASYHAMIVLLL